MVSVLYSLRTTKRKVISLPAGCGQPNQKLFAYAQVADNQIINGFHTLQIADNQMKSHFPSRKLNETKLKVNCLFRHLQITN